MKRQRLLGALRKIEDGVVEAAGEVAAECNPLQLLPSTGLNVAAFNWREYLHIPFLPAFHRPGWMMWYLLGPYDVNWSESIIADLQAGFTVLMTLIPQALSQAQLATMPPIYGLYTSLLPTASYAFFGSSMQLTVGPTALISLMTATLLAKYDVDSSVDLDLAVDTTAQAAFCVGIIIAVLGLLNMGNLINFMSYPVMSGFTTGAALTIGITQLKAAVGFALSPPQVGGAVEYNYQVMKWWKENWNGHDAKGHQLRNFYAVKICFGLYVPLMIVQLIKWAHKPTAEQKKTYWYKAWNFFTSVLPLAAIIIAGHVAYNIKKEDHFNDHHVHHSYYAKGLKIVGELPSGLDILRTPRFRHPMGPFLVDVIPITLIAFMESYVIARSIGAQTNTLHYLSASQEMFANGVANLLGCVSSSYPVSGSFSRSALNAACGARTPLSKCVGIIGVIICLTSLTKALQYVPQAALAAVIFVAIANLIHISDFWTFWKHSKKDFFTALVTLMFVFVYDSSIGLAVGLATSILVYCVFDIIFAKSHSPRLFTSARDGNVDVVRIESDLNFLTAARIKDFICALAVKKPTEPAADSWSLTYRYKIASSFDYVLKPHLLNGVEELPKAIVIDMCIVKTVDISGLAAISTALAEVRSHGVLVSIINTNPEIWQIFKRYGIKNDLTTEEVNFEEYEAAYRIDLWTILDRRTRVQSAEVADGDTFVEMELSTVADAQIVEPVDQKNAVPLKYHNPNQSGDVVDVAEIEMAKRL